MRDKRRGLPCFLNTLGLSQILAHRLIFLTKRSKQMDKPKTKQTKKKEDKTKERRLGIIFKTATESGTKMPTRCRQQVKSRRNREAKDNTWEQLNATLGRKAASLLHFDLQGIRPLRARHAAVSVECMPVTGRAVAWLG